MDSLTNDLDIQDIVLHNLQLAIQGCIDIGSHVISDEGWGVSGSLNEIFYILQKKGVIKADMAERMISWLDLEIYWFMGMKLLTSISFAISCITI